MSYHVHISAADRAYLNGLPLSDGAKERVEDFIEYAIADVEDAVRNDPANRLGPDKPYFQRDLMLMDEDTVGAKSFHKISFTVKDENAAAGVLFIVYVEHKSAAQRG